MIPVTKTYLPRIDEYMAQIKRAFDNQWLTNRGELVVELEQKIKLTLGLSDTSFLITNNGTIPLQIAVKILGGGGEVITTPFSYVATTSSIVWENCTPVFVDIDSQHLTIDERLIESAITKRTTAILATHVFGNPCHVEAIEGIARKHNLKVIYDAAHCFGVNYRGKSIFEYGDISTCSFHATKLFHCGEGGGLFASDKELFHKAYYSHNFGHNGPLDFHGLGINGKISELQAAMGLAVLPHFDEILSARKAIVSAYETQLNSNGLQSISIREQTDWNYSYYPVMFQSEAELLRVVEALNKRDIFPRRYFYPSLSTLPYLSSTHHTPIANDISKRIACLPLYTGLSEESLNDIIQIINENL